MIILWVNDYNIKNYKDFEFNKDTQNIGLLIRNGSSTYIRILSPLSELKTSEYTPYIIYGADIHKFKEDLINNIFLMDMLIIERDAINYSLSQLIIEKCNLFNINIIYTIDDDLINIDKTHIQYELYSKKSKNIQYLVENSQEVIVSTEYLKNKMLEFNNNVKIIPNVLTKDWNNEDDYKNLEQPREVIKIGYMGTTTHANDLKLINEAIYNVQNHYKENNKEIVFEMVGGSDEELDWAKKLKVPSNKTIYPKFVKWLRKTVNWDIAVAPLEDTVINRSKSNLKYLEYTGLNIPGIYSNVGPYKEITHEHNGLLSDNSVESWEKNIIRLIDDKNLYENILKNALSDVKNNYVMKNVVDLWIETLNSNKREKNEKSYNLICLLTLKSKELSNENMKLKKKLKKEKKINKRLKNSKSWKITKHLRKINYYLKKYNIF